ncbi:hypothetical protein L915_22025 [Phytophthora nicotianae]|uniref:Uncharacterized protein n=1 Tax=Phytophthora nicotianae TaxID=4792 RepID=W2FIP5_PHYNI|nr:hypothetical protein L915_22025 [Phytophthora nicotianae]
MVEKLQFQWGESFNAEGVQAVTDPPPQYVARMLRAPDSYPQRQLSELSRSAKMALECVGASLDDYHVLREDWNAFNGD